MTNQHHEIIRRIKGARRQRERDRERDRETEREREREREREKERETERDRERERQRKRKRERVIQTDNEIHILFFTNAHTHHSYRLYKHLKVRGGEDRKDKRELEGWGAESEESEPGLVTGAWGVR